METKRILKIAWRGAACLILLVVIALGVAWIYIDRIAAKMVTTGVRTVGEVDCKLDDMSVSLIRGRVYLSGLAIGNPAKFPQTEMFRLGEATLEVGVGSVFDQPLHVEILEIHEPFVRWEAGWGGTNIRAFLSTIERNLASEHSDDSPEAEPVRLVIDRLVIRDATVQIGSGIHTSGVSIPLQTVELSNIRGRDGRGVTAGELTGILVFELARRGAIRFDIDVSDLAPAAFAKRMESVAGSIAGVTGRAAKVVAGAATQAADTVVDAGGKAAGAVAGAATQAADTVVGAGGKAVGAVGGAGHKAVGAVKDLIGSSDDGDE